MANDTISRQAAIRFIRDKVSLSLFMKRSVDKADKACMELCEMLDKDLPSAERRGRWEHYEHREPQYDIEGYKTWAEAYKCSNCGFIHTVIEDFGHYAFCPRCGADMREAKNGCDDCFIPMFYNLEDDDSICRDCGVGE